MNAKVQKEFKLIIGTNNEKVTKDFLAKKAHELEQLGNNRLNVRIHIFEK